MKSFKFLRQGDNNHTIVEANIALESMLKIFLSKKGIPIKDDRYTLDKLWKRFVDPLIFLLGRKNLYNASWTSPKTQAISGIRRDMEVQKLLNTTPR